jgi:ubiquinone/menaquinone biosynthesis C-methylase UbiE
MNTAAKNNSFSDCYLSVRQKEARIMQDEELLLLPETGKDHPHASEWKRRAWSSRQLESYLGKKNRPLSILEVGCGNGWLSNRLSYLPETDILGIDINRTELVQARKVFRDRKNLRFFPGTIDDLFPSFRFDVILFAASIQYFPDLDITIDKAVQLLEKEGEIHIIDSHFYDRKEVNEARQRSRDYFRTLNEPGMTEFYFHHPFSSLEDYNYRVLYNPKSIFSRMTGNPSPFHWIRIQH